jgi:hypothetical protein
MPSFFGNPPSLIGSDVMTCFRRHLCSLSLLVAEWVDDDLLVIADRMFFLAAMIAVHYALTTGKLGLLFVLLVVTAITKWRIGINNDHDQNNQNNEKITYELPATTDWLNRIISAFW